ncbi:hypothetical protein GCM10011415_29210 [Salipiger pallidus]|uniref:Enterobactin synthase component D n=1 Tax=Salipiger pallidus TaxID=1775170 RepID=A0A8J2ZL70_9RHOB|nr:4'-phosphopantetheinyl transferase superfamily protein [Salipiger pallidus]GGG78386.1 hypothetical protein GCM10011415_29210 [Salipiger pallidus]
MATEHRASRFERALVDTGIFAGLGFAVALPTNDPGALFPQERAALRRAVPARLAEFAGGRIAARRAMAAIGLPGAPIPMNPDRSPRWPDGVVGSISHGGGLCLAVVGHARDWQAIGIDLEPDTDLPSDAIPEIASEEELSRLDLPRARAATRIFGAKEAAYKAQFPRTKCVFGFDAMASFLPQSLMRMTTDVGPGIDAEFPMAQQVIEDIQVSACLVR